MLISAQSVAISWGPGFSIGVTISLVMFGVSFGQVVVYFQSFPRDSRSMKLAVLTIFMLDCLHTIGLVGTFRRVLVLCHRTTSPDCQASYGWEQIAILLTNYIISLFVQSFYAHRVWIISARNKFATGAILLAAFCQILFGLLCVSTVVNAGDWHVMFDHPGYPALAAASSSACDALITISVAYFLRTERPQTRKQDNYIHHLKVVFMEMGLLSCIISLLVVVALMLGDYIARTSWAIAVGPILTKAYFNSMLAVLNTRRVIRQRQLEAHGLMYDLVTL